MFVLNSLSLFATIASCVLATPAPEHAGRIVEKSKGVPEGWAKDISAKLDKNESLIRLRIHLVQQDMHVFHDLATNIATPGHELYGKHLNQEVIDNIIAPKDESTRLAESWLRAEGLTGQSSISPRADSIILEASIAQVEKLLNAQYETFVNEKTGDSIIRTLQYSMPKSLEGHVDMIQPTTFFGLRAMKSMVTGLRPLDGEVASTEAVAAVKGCTGIQITPECLSNLYSYGNATNYKTGLLGIAGFLEEYPIKTDLATFMRNYATQGNANQSFTCTLVNNGTCPQNAAAGIEANLDVQYARAITQSIPNVYYSVGGRGPWLSTGPNTNEPYLEFLDYMLALPAASLPNTLSISYGDAEFTLPDAYAIEACNLFAQLGARGVSILVASGDSGTCTSGGNPKMFGTSFPASCPWVTTVGGTTGNSPEKAWAGSGGGFSEVFDRPAYQKETISKWFATDTTHNSSTQYFNQTGRAYPDIAAESTDFIIVVSGQANAVDGTSCSTPTFAGIIQLLNSDRLASGKSPLGFLNPWLYSSAPPGLTDITSGLNIACINGVSGAGFAAVPGWDPVTGLGTPIYSSLLAISRAT